MARNSSTKKLTLSEVLRWIFVAFLVLMAIGQFSSGGVFAGICTTLAIVLLMPWFNSYIETHHNFEISTPLKTVIVVILLILSFASSPDVETNNSLPYNTANSQSGNVGTLEVVEESITDSVATDSTTQSAPIPTIHTPGERVVVGNFAYTLHSYTTKTEIGERYRFGDDESFYGDEARGVFVVIDMTIENIGKESATLWSSPVKLINVDTEAIYDYDSEAAIYDEDSISFYEQFQPGLPVRGNVIFDVPSNIKVLVQISSDNTWSKDKEYFSLK